jgi:hypothetical protein
MSLESEIGNRVLEKLKGVIPNDANLNETLRLLAKWRSVLIQDALIDNQGTTVMQGPLKGMSFLKHSAEGCHIAKILGTYEQPLQPYINKATVGTYDQIVNIGCAEGYYAVGMAQKMQNTHVTAFDLNPKAQEVCLKLASQNGVSDRVTVGALFQPTDFEKFLSQKVLVICDIEGGERDLLNPEFSPALKNMDLIVESHECLLPGITQALIARFAKSHNITLVQDNGQRYLNDAPQWFNNLAHLDQLLATWEWRSGPTPWLVMYAK